MLVLRHYSSLCIAHSSYGYDSLAKRFGLTHDDRPKFISFAFVCRWRLFMKRLFTVIALASLVVCCSPLLAVSQGIQQTPYSAADAVRRSWPSIAPDFTTSHPRGLPRSSLVGSDNITISSGMFQGLLPNVPNLQLGYNYTPTTLLIGRIRLQACTSFYVTCGPDGFGSVSRLPVRSAFLSCAASLAR